LILGGGVVVLLGLAGVIALALRGGGESPAPAPTSAPAPEATMPRVADDEAARAAAMLAGEAPPEPAQPEPAQPEPAPEPVKAPPPAPTPEPVAPRTAPAKAPPPTKAPPKPAEASKPPPAPKTPAPTKSTTKSSAAPAPASAPAASGGSFSVRFSVPGREARVQCGDGQAADFSGATSMTFATTTTCLVKVDHGRGAVQVSQTGTVTCAEDAGKVSCSGN
jgi:outer membrane biosynthesis protein TonB